MPRSIRFDKKALERADLRRAAYHEAAHGVIARRFGAVVEELEWRNANGGLNEKFWIGTTRMYAPPGTARPILGPEFLDPPPNAMRIICLGGVIGEYLLKKLDQENKEVGSFAEDDLFVSVYEHVTNLFEGDELSETDAEPFAEREPDEIDVRQALHILIDKWSWVEMGAKSLMSNPGNKPSRS